MSVAVDEVRDSIETLREDQRQSLVTFIVLDAALTAVSVPFILVVYVTIAAEPYLLATGLIVAAAAAIMSVGARLARRGEISAAVGWLAAGNWIAIVTGAVLAPVVWPIFPIAALLPAVVAASYVRQDQFRYYLASSITIATSTTLLGLFANVTSIRDDVPVWVTDLLQALFVPVLTGTLGFLALQNFSRVRSLVVSMSDAHDSVRFQASDLLASRSRMVAATDRERRRIERDLHDGTQQHFVAIAMKLAAIKMQLTASDTHLSDELDALRSDVRAAQRNLRDMTSAIYPPTLSQHGLTSAVRFIADRFTTNVTTDIDDVGRCDPDIEAAVYFTTMEALQNASKHAGEGAHVRIELHRDHDELRFSVSDDGRGFEDVESASVRSGGIMNMRDRMGAVLGYVSIDSTPGQGTQVTGTVPVPQRG